MAVDMSIDLIQATVQVEQPLGDGTRTVGTGFLVSDPTPDGKPRTVLVTANHVFNRMPGAKATIGYRIENPDGSWRYDPRKITIRAGGRALWTHHATRDVAAISIKAPAEFAKAAIPLAWLAGADAFTTYKVAPGDKMMALGFPQGLSANAAGFPILRSGRVASYPLAPSAAFPTFLLDFRVFPGNSGGPVYVDGPSHFVAGMLTQQVELDSENLGIGIVTQSEFIRETLAQLDGAKAPQALAAGADTPAAAQAVAADSAATAR